MLAVGLVLAAGIPLVWTLSRPPLNEGPVPHTSTPAPPGTAAPLPVGP